ncbi:hypothetical protein C8J57DRAFT_1514561 [Mycena rebaudengoi]|nr:hypothetical protein C8J57DRAFT_1514561 [Mycena rebaudengoi]
MPRKLNPHLQRTQYSNDLKQQVIYQAFTLEKETTQIVIDLNMFLCVAQHVLMTWEEIGEVCRDRSHIGRTPILSPEQMTFMLTLIDDSPDIYLDEIQE